MSTKILYVEDDETLAFLTKDTLEHNGYEVFYAENGIDAWDLFKKNHFDLCIFDVMLPHKDGFTLAKEIRGINDSIPIIFLTARSQKQDKIEGLTLGGDDYLTKPFSIEELLLKIEIFLRRKNVIAPSDYMRFNLSTTTVLDAKNLLLIINGEERGLTQKESDLLQLFVENKSTTLKRAQILEKVWGKDDYFLGRSLDVFISRLRKYLSPDESLQIENVHGVGFRLRGNDKRYFFLFQF